MEIATLAAGVVALTNKEIETSIQAISFEMTGPHGGAVTPATILTAVVGNAEINLTKQDSGDTQSIIQSLSIRDLAEIAANNDGIIKIVTNGANCVVSFTIEVSLDAALALNDSGKIMLAISGIPVGTATNIDGLDHPLQSGTYVKYEAKFVNANVGKDFNIEQHFAIALPIANVKALEMTYSNGKNVKMSPREIKQALTDSQDVIFNYDGKTTFGFDKWAVLDVQHVLTVRVTLDASTNFYLLKNQAI